MKTLSLTILFVSLFSFSKSQSVGEILKKGLNAIANENSAPKTIKTVTLVTTTKKLNGTIRGTIGGGMGATSQIQIPVTLPPNTVEWYYSFSTTNGGAGGLKDGLKLGFQLASLVSGLAPAALALTLVKGLSSQDANSIKVPTGYMPANVYLISPSNVNLFMQKKQFTYYESQSSLQATQAMVKVNSDDLKQGTFYLGLQNISSTNANYITIEVVALIAE